MTDSGHRLNSSASDANFKLSCESVLTKLIRPEQAVLDAILACNHTDQPEITGPDGQVYIWYLAIGSMINPISLYLRDLVPLMSYPATCIDHNVVYRGAMGMANIEPCSGASFDGVVHLLTKEQMARLDEIEAFYRRIPVTCQGYQNQSQVAYAYHVNVNNQPVGLPHERYLDIIIKGCEYYQVRPEYVARVRAEQPVVPRKPPSKFRSFTDMPADAFFSLEELQRHNGEDPSLPIWVSINGKILEHTGLPPTDHPDYELQKHFHSFVRQRFAGREVSGMMAKNLYEPMYKIPVNDDDISEEHRAHIEDHYFEMLNNPQNKGFWKPIGRLRPSSQSSI